MYIWAICMRHHIGIICVNFFGLFDLQAFLADQEKAWDVAWHFGMAGYCNCYLGIKYPTFNPF